MHFIPLKGMQRLRKPFLWTSLNLNVSKMLEEWEYFAKVWWMWNATANENESFPHNFTKARLNNSQ